MAIAVSDMGSSRTSSFPRPPANPDLSRFALQALGTVLSDVGLGTTTPLGPTAAVSLGTTGGGEIARIAKAIGAHAESKPWLEYLSRLPNHTVARAAERLWRHASGRVLQQTGRLLPAPLTIRSDDDSINLAWDAGRHYVDVDVFPNGTIEWFYRDRRTEALDGTEEPCAASPLPEGLLERLKLVAR